MGWSKETLFGKARTFIERANRENIDSPLYALWTSLALELLARAAIAKIHPALLADPREPENIFFAFGINPTRAPKSIQAKTLFNRCKIFVSGFTEEMVAHCVVMADRRNSDLHSGIAAFENLNNAAWLPATYEAFEVLLAHLGVSFEDFMGRDRAQVADRMLRDRSEHIRRDIADRMARAKRDFGTISEAELGRKLQEIQAALQKWAEVANSKVCNCPVCGSQSVRAGEIAARGAPHIDEASGTITRDAQILPSLFRCRICGLVLKGFQEMRAAGLGDIFTVEEQEDPIEFFGINPEDYIDVDKFMRSVGDDYGNE